MTLHSSGVKTRGYMVQTKSVCKRVEGKTGLTGRTSLVVKIPASGLFIGGRGGG